MARFTLLISLLIFPFIVFADTYPSVVYTAEQQCIDHIGFVGSQYSGDPSLGYNAGQWSGLKCKILTNGTWTNTAFYNAYNTCPGGGTVSGSNCINATACDAGSTRSPTTGLCEVSCPASGTTKTISILSEKKVNTGGDMTITIDGDPDGSKTAYESECEYTYTDSDFNTDTGCYTVPGDIPDGMGNVPVYCAYTATSTGVKDSNAQTTAVDPTVNAPGSTPVESSDSGNCVTDSTGNKLCASSTSGPGCGTVNGTAVCPQTSGTGTVNGQPYTVSEKNCGMVNGKPVCVSSDLSSPTTIGCLVNGGVRACLNSDLTESETKGPVQTLPDGTTVETTTTDNNLIGDPGGTTTKSTGTDGTITTTKTGSDSTDGKTDCDKNPESLGCKALGDMPDGTGGDEIPNETVVINALSPVSLAGGSGSCPADLSANYLGKTVTFSFEKPCEFASMFSPVMIAFAWLSAALIVVGPVRS